METPQTPHQIHAEAVTSEGLSHSERIALLTEAIMSYRNDFDRARALRDRGKERYLDGETDWQDDLHESVRYFAEENKLARSAELEGLPNNREDVARELGASSCMYGRLIMHMQLSGDADMDAMAAFVPLLRGLEEIRNASTDPRPDQYEVNFAAILAIVEAYGEHDRLGNLARVVYTLYLAAISESATRVQHPNPEASPSYKAKRRAQALARSGFAAFATVAPKKLRESRIVRTTGAKLL